MPAADLQGKIKGSYTADKMLEFCRRGTLSAAQLVLGIDKNLPYVARQVVIGRAAAGCIVARATVHACVGSSSCFMPAPSNTGAVLLPQLGQPAAGRAAGCKLLPPCGWTPQHDRDGRPHQRTRLVAAVHAATRPASWRAVRAAGVRRG